MSEDRTHFEVLLENMNISLKVLADSVASLFDAVHQLTARVARLEESFDRRVTMLEVNMNTRFAIVENRITALENRFAALEVRLTRIEGHLDLGGPGHAEQRGEA